MTTRRFPVDITVQRKDDGQIGRVVARTTEAGVKYAIVSTSNGTSLRWAFRDIAIPACLTTR